MKNELLDEHLTPNELEDAKTLSPEKKEAIVVFKILIAFQTLLALVFSVLVWVDLDNFMGFGMSHILIGFLGGIVGFYTKDKKMLTAEIGTLLFSIVSFVILNSLGSGYHIAHTPIAIALGVYTVLICWYAYTVFFPVKPIAL